MARRADWVLAALVMGVVGALVVPLPGGLVDGLVVANLAVAATLLVVVLAARDGLELATFPSLLVLTTLARLAIEVSTARLVLGRADAGAVVAAFGRVVVGGNVAVGLVVFVIVTLVQYLVIARGAERVAEVGARFALDALPGQQMGIDAELRAGSVDQAEAQKRRVRLARESQFFGAMDGAMKFVKGDAIAGIVIVLVNLVGGLAIGIGQRGMDPEAALRRYGILTIGAGLVAQIPALLLATAAGLLTTRVAGDDAGLGTVVARQVFARPRALAVVAGLLAAVALVPGVPVAPFAVIAAVMALGAWRLRKSHGEDRGAGLRAAVTVRVSRGVGRSVVERLRSAALPALRERLWAERGLPLPAIEVEGMDDEGFAVAVAGVTRVRGGLADDEVEAQLNVTAAVERALRRHGHELVGIEETERLLATLRQTHPALVREVVPRRVSHAVLAQVLRALVAEGISLRALPEIMEALAQEPEGRAAEALTERVRVALRGVITEAHCGSTGELDAWVLEPLIEDTLVDAARNTPAGGGLALEPDLARDVIAAVEMAVPRDDEASPAVVVTRAAARRPLRTLIEAERPDVVVLSYDELLPATAIAARGTIRVG